MTAQLPEISISSKECFQDANQRAKSQGKMLGSSHFVYSLLTYADNSMFDLIRLLGANPDQLAPAIKSLELQEPDIDMVTGENKTPGVYGALLSLEKVMNKVGDTKATMEVILASFCNGQDATAKTLVSYGVNEAKIIKAITHLRSTSTASNEPQGVAETKTLSKFGEDLTAKARGGKIDPVIGRDSETRRVMQILSRRTKNNPVIVGEPGVGKALFNDTLIPVKDNRGYVKISDIKIGDYVFSRTGKPVLVSGVYPQGKKGSYRVVFNDGSAVVCSEDHLWTGWSFNDYQSGKGSRTLSLVDIMHEMNMKPGKKIIEDESWFIPMSEPVKREEQDFGTHPYVIGALLGAGDMRKSAIHITTQDKYVANKVASLLPSATVEEPMGSSDDWIFYSRKSQGNSIYKGFFLKEDFKRLGDVSSLIEYSAKEQRIPEHYLYGSIEQRFALLQGLMDTCGEVGHDVPGHFQCRFSTSSRNLSQDVIHLAYTLGIRTTTKSQQRMYHVDFLPTDYVAQMFSTPEKMILAQDMRQRDETKDYKKNTLHISYIEPVGLQDSTCIYVDDDEHLFLCGKEHLTTHNTAIVEGLARRIVAGDCPEQLKDKTIYALDLAALSAGAKYQGEYEERVKSVLSDIKKAEGKIITFIDEIHMISSGDGSPMNLSNMLKPMLARGEMHLIGATTLSEYRQFIESDPALDRRFQQVVAPEPSVEDTIGILRGIKEKYETHHGIKIQDSALISCAELSDRYLTSRFLPDKAIDLMDEASSRLTMLIDSRPEEIDVLEKKVRSLEIEEVALKNEYDSDGTSSLRLEEVQQELTDYREKLSSSKSAWENQREGTQKMKRLRQRLVQLQEESERAEREGEYGRVSQLRYGEIPELQEKIRYEEEAATSQGIDTRLISEEVTPDIVAEVVSSVTGVPASKMNESDIEKVMSMGDELSREVVGQPEAVHALVKAVKRSRAGVSNPNRPVGNFLFAGPSGTGKTQLSKALAHYLYDDSSALISFSMEEYTDKASINKLIGSPAGYVGYGDTPALEAVRNRPSSVVLFDELEKADDQVITTLLSIMEEGKITLNNGTEVDFTNTIIIFTSNLGAGEGKEGVDAAIKSRLRPEFINRLDAVVAFNSLSVENLESVVDIQVRHLEETMKGKKITFSISNEARRAIAEMGYDPMYGARPVRRIVSGQISDMLADAIIVGEITPGDEVFIYLNKEGKVSLGRRDDIDSIPNGYRDKFPSKNEENTPVEDGETDDLDSLFGV